jgi:ribokinase
LPAIHEIRTFWHRKHFVIALDFYDIMDSANITVVGSLMVDHIFFINRLPDIGETYPTDKYQKAPGGKGANAAIATHRTCHTKPQPQTPSPSKASLDINVRMVGAVGKDAEGTYMLDALRRNNMDDAGVARVDENTGMMFVMVQQTEDSVDNRLISTIGANATLKPESFATEDTLHVVKGTQPDLIVTQLELELATIERILETSGKAGIKVLLNAAPAITILSELYRYVTHLIVNETEAAILSGREVNEVCKETWKEIAQEFLQEGIENVVITLGADGAFYANSDDFGHIPAFKIDPVDPTGAG